MKINVKSRGRRLETISKEDTLIFKDREEAVEEVDNLTGTLYTRRIVNTRKVFLFKQEYIVYNHIEKISPASKGKVYDWMIARAS